MADEGRAWSEDFVRSLQAGPYLRGASAGGTIDVSSGPFKVSLANVTFTASGPMLAVGGVPVLHATVDSAGMARISGVFHDPEGRPLARIVDNEWRVSTKLAWDVDFRAGGRQLVVRLAKGRVALRMEITDRALKLRRCLFRVGDSFVRVVGNDHRMLITAVSMRNGVVTTLHEDSTKIAIEFDPGKFMKVG
jgi:hypothetical protein